MAERPPARRAVRARHARLSIRGAQPRIADCTERAHGFEAHEGARVGREGRDRGQRVHRAQQPEGRDRHRALAFVRVREVPDERRNRRGADPGEHRGELVAQFLRERRHFAERFQERADDADPVLRQRVPRALVNRRVRAPKVRDGFGQRPALPNGREQLLEQHEREERLVRAEEQTGGPQGGAHHREPHHVLRHSQVEHVHEAVQVNERVDQEVRELRERLIVAHRVPPRADGRVQAEVQQREPADRGDRRRREQRHADAPPVSHQVRREQLPLQRVVNRLVAAFDFVPLHVDRHVREARRHAHDDS